MDAPKTAASLTSGLLARKGMAQPAMRRQSVTGLGAIAGSGANTLPGSPRAVPAPQSLEDLGWNDMGEDRAESAPAPAPSPVAVHIAAIQETLDRRRAERRAESATPAPAQAPAQAPTGRKPARTVRAKAAPAPAAKGKSAFTLRIDADRHLRLRLLSAVSHRSAQQLLTGALDALLEQHPQIDALAANPKLRQGIDDTGME
ncbi:MAG: hypothetical protein ABW048_05455 [Sphingobium sp.]